jgi:hypothetical protein
MLILFTEKTAIHELHPFIIYTKIVIFARINYLYCKKTHNNYQQK